jgi:hypothetical protein
MTAPFLIVGHSTTMMDDNGVANCGAQDLLPTSGSAILFEQDAEKVRQHEEG